MEKYNGRFYMRAPRVPIQYEEADDDPERPTNFDPLADEKNPDFCQGWRDDLIFGEK